MFVTHQAFSSKISDSDSVRFKIVTTANPDSLADAAAGLEISKSNRRRRVKLDNTLKRGLNKIWHGAMGWSATISWHLHTFQESTLQPHAAFSPLDA